MQRLDASFLSFLGAFLVGFMIFSAGAEAETTDKIRVEGSTSMGQMVYHWAESYMKANPTTKINVVSNGTPVGLRAVREGKADMAMASRKISTEEAKQFADNGIKLVETAVGLEGVALIVNKANPVKELTLEQLKSILTGEWATWDKLGGPAEQIRFMLRKPSQSGTSTFLQTELLKDAKFSTSAGFRDYYDWVARDVGDAPWSFGVVAYSFADKDKVKILSVRKDEKSPAVTPCVESFEDGSYPLTRPFFLYTRDSSPSYVKEFAEYCKSKSRDSNDH